MLRRLEIGIPRRWVCQFKEFSRVPVDLKNVILTSFGNEPRGTETPIAAFFQQAFLGVNSPTG